MRAVLIVALACGLCSCIIPAPSGEGNGGPSERKVVTNTPPIDVPNGANFGDKVSIERVMIAPGRINPGETARVSVFYRVLDTMEIDYSVFVHVEDVDGKVDRINADHPPAGGSNPTSKWQKGTLVRDDFAIYVPPGMPARGLNLLMGFWDPRTDSRLALKNVNAVRHDGTNRVFVAQIPLGN